jgi:hypothetical protein
LIFFVLPCRFLQLVVPFLLDVHVRILAHPLVRGCLSSSPTWCYYLSSSSMLLLVLLLISLLNVVVHSPSCWYYLSSFDAIVAKL